MKWHFILRTSVKQLKVLDNSLVHRSVCKPVCMCVCVCVLCACMGVHACMCVCMGVRGACKHSCLSSCMLVVSVVCRQVSRRVAANAFILTQH